MLDQILGQMGLGNKSGDLMAMIAHQLQQQGGLQGLLAKLNQSGLQNQAASWVGTGQNEPMTPDQAHDVLGSNFVQEASSKLGVPEDQVRQAAAHALPNMVDKMTPEGNVPEGHDLMDSLKGMMGGNMPDIGSLLGGFLGK